MGPPRPRSPPLSLHDALPIFPAIVASFTPAMGLLSVFGDNLANTVTVGRNAAGQIQINGGAVSVQGGTPTVARSEEHTSELQSQSNLVCRLWLDNIHSGIRGS